MFGPNPLPPPTSFGHEHRPLRLTSESARSHPQGSCHFQSVPGQNQRCLCQSFQHNRSAPGNICDCGHSACYHSQTNNERRISPDRIVSALAEKVKKLEESMIKERESRDNLLIRERQAWEREVRVLREALAPFYRSEQDMTRRLVEVEDRMDATREMQLRLTDRLSLIEDASNLLGQKAHHVGRLHSRKRKATLTHESNGLMSPEPNDASSTSDATSVSQQSPISTSPIDDHLLANASSQRMSPPHEPVGRHHTAKIIPGFNPIHQYHQQLPSPEDEPRSSGFLSIDLADRVRKHKPTPPARVMHDLPVLPSINRELPSAPQALLGKVVTGVLPVSGLLSNAGCRSEDGSESRMQKKRKQQNGIMALDVLANVTVASPLAH